MVKPHLNSMTYVLTDEQIVVIPGVNYTSILVYLSTVNSPQRQDDICIRQYITHIDGHVTHSRTECGESSYTCGYHRRQCILTSLDILSSYVTTSGLGALGFITQDTRYTKRGLYTKQDNCNSVELFYAISKYTYYNSLIAINNTTNQEKHQY
jgi:hypothetical protein